MKMFGGVFIKILKREDESENPIDFLLLMVIECQLLCVFRELLALTPEELAMALGFKSSSSISKTEAKNEVDAFKTKLKILRHLGLSADYYSGLTMDAMRYYHKYRNQLIGIEAINQILEVGPKQFGNSISKKCKDAEHYAMRIACLMAIAHACDFKIEPLEQELLKHTWKEGKAELVLKRDEFEESVEAWEQVKFFLPKDALMRIWQITEENAHCLKEKNKQIMNELKVWRQTHE